MKITLAHGSGGQSTSELISSVFAKHFSNPILNSMEDSAVVDGAPKIAFTTDSFVVTPTFFKGGDIGRLAVCGTVNDLLMRGAQPKFLSAAFIIEEGADTDDLEKIAISMANTAAEAGVMIVTGDTKVVEGHGGVFINTAGIGYIKHDIDISASSCADGDVIIVSGNLGDHHATILSARMSIDNDIQSDNAPLCDIVTSLLDKNIPIHTLRDVTRGGLGTVLCEIAKASGTSIEITESALPIDPQVKAFTKILGLNILHMGNEGKLIAIVPSEYAQEALTTIKSAKYGENAAIIGRVTTGDGSVIMKTPIGGKRAVTVLYGEGLPRIC